MSRLLEVCVVCIPPFKVDLTLFFFQLAILSGMTNLKRSAKKPGDPPLLLHISGCGCLSDNAQGNAAKDLKIYSDLDLDLELWVPLFCIPLSQIPNMIVPQTSER